MRVLDAIKNLSVRRFHTQLVADANVAQGAELPIAVRGDGAVAFLPGPRRVRQVTGRAIEGIRAVALDDHGRDAEPRNLEQAD